MKEKVNRKTFLTRLWIGLGALAAVQLGGISFFYFGKKSEEKASEEMLFSTIGKVEDYKPGSVTPFRNGRFYLVRYPNGGFLALSLTCTHLGCSISYESDKNEFICPCHSSVFDIYGDVVNPPAPRTLDMLPIQIINGNLQVAVGDKIHRKKFEESQLVYA
ncbi:MAG TPA: Rieske (2Fe-2S) protein [Bacteroidales bacterium]